MGVPSSKLFPVVHAEQDLLRFGTQAYKAVQVLKLSHPWPGVLHPALRASIGVTPAPQSSKTSRSCCSAPSNLTEAAADSAG